jgi:hypothetical protein
MPRLLAATLLIAVVLAASGAEPANALTLVGGTANWTVVGAPRPVAIGLFSAAATTFHNNLDVQVIGVVIMVIHNRAGQTISYSTATLNLTRGFSGTAYTVESGLPSGVYNSTIFAFSTAGVAISNSTTIGFLAR